MAAASSSPADRVFLLSLPDGSLELHHRPRMTAADALQAHPRHWLSASASRGQSLSPDRELKPSGTYFLRLHERELKPSESGAYFPHRTDMAPQRALTAGRASCPPTIGQVSADLRRRSVSDRRPQQTDSSLELGYHHTAPDFALPGGAAAGGTEKAGLPQASAGFQLRAPEVDGYISAPHTHWSMVHQRGYHWEDHTLRRPQQEEADVRQQLQLALARGLEQHGPRRLRGQGHHRSGNLRVCHSEEQGALLQAEALHKAPAGQVECPTAQCKALASSVECGPQCSAARGHVGASDCAGWRRRQRSPLLEEIGAWEQFDSDSSSSALATATSATEGPSSPSANTSPHLVRPVIRQHQRRKPLKQLSHGAHPTRGDLGRLREQQAALRGGSRALHRIAAFFSRVPLRAVPGITAAGQYPLEEDRDLRGGREGALLENHMERGRMDLEGWNVAPDVKFHTFSAVERSKLCAFQDVDDQ